MMTHWNGTIIGPGHVSVPSPLTAHRHPPAIASDRVLISLILDRQFTRTAFTVSGSTVARHTPTIHPL